MPEHPILMSAPMVRATLADLKTMTRRVVSLRPFDHCCSTPTRMYLPHYGPEAVFGGPCYLKVTYCESCDGAGDRIRPRWEIGDLLWVREAWRVGAWNVDNGEIAVDYRADNYARREWIAVPDPDQWQRLWEQSSDDAMDAGRKMDSEGEYHWTPGESPCRWRPSIHMPRWASRLTLRVTDVRVERVQDITEEDAVREGCAARPGIVWQTFDEADRGEPMHPHTARDDFAALWDALNERRGHGWDTNPWVWVVSFEVLP